MMNAARYGVGVQGIGIAERAYQKAVTYARERVQSRPVDGSTPGAAAIIHHPDVQRMLMTMRALTEGCRAFAAVAAAAYDTAHAHPDEATRKQSHAVYEFFVPLLKGFATEMSLEAASLGVQVHGARFLEQPRAHLGTRGGREGTLEGDLPRERALARGEDRAHGDAPRAPGARRSAKAAASSNRSLCFSDRICCFGHQAGTGFASEPACAASTRTRSTFLRSDS